MTDEISLVMQLDRADWFVVGVGTGIATTAFLFWLMETTRSANGAIPL